MKRYWSCQFGETLGGHWPLYVWETIEFVFQVLLAWCTARSIFFFVIKTKTNKHNNTKQFRLEKTKCPCLICHLFCVPKKIKHIVDKTPFITSLLIVFRSLQWRNTIYLKEYKEINIELELNFSKFLIIWNSFRANRLVCCMCTQRNHISARIPISTTIIVFCHKNSKIKSNKILHRHSRFVVDWIEQIACIIFYTQLQRPVYAHPLPYWQLNSSIEAQLASKQPIVYKHKFESQLFLTN